MTEEEWLVSDAPDSMLLYLHDKVSDRKFRLFACACTRLVGHLLKAKRARELVARIEQWADDTDIGDEFPCGRQVYQLEQQLKPHTAERLAAEAVGDAAGSGPWAAAWQVTSTVRRALQARKRGPVVSPALQQAALLRHIFGNPFAPPVFDPGWRTEATTAIARAAYDERRWDDLPFLADALEEAGCTDEAILRHFREPGEHVRGCWVLDLVLGKE